MGKQVVALGLMSGTSLDGVDAAFVTTDGAGIESFGPSATFAYTPEERRIIAEATRACLAWNFSGPPPNSLSRAKKCVEAAHIRAVERMRCEHPDWADRLDLIGFHGQTVLHRPPSGDGLGRTLQIGDGQRLADRLGVAVAHDFRSADMAAGGQGAPLAPVLHAALAEEDLSGADLAVLNIGGVSNLTLIGEALRASDCGPGNGLLDLWIEARTGAAYDAGGEISLSGVPDFGRVARWMDRDFFAAPVPKSADRHDFDVLDEVEGLSTADGAATFCLFTAQAVAHTLTRMGADPDLILVCGGGRHNRAMMWMLAEVTTARIAPTEALGWDGDAVEAVLMAYLAVRSRNGQPISFPSTTGVPRPMTGGRTAFPRGE